MTDLDVSTMQTFSLSEAVASTTSIAVASLSKTGFAATLVQSSKGWPRAVAWMTIIVVNITAGTVALLLWLQCTPLRKVFVILDYGYCWPDSVRTTSQILNSCESRRLQREQRMEMCPLTLLSQFSCVWHCRYRAVIDRCIRGLHKNDQKGILGRSMVLRIAWVIVSKMLH